MTFPSHSSEFFFFPHQQSLYYPFNILFFSGRKIRIKKGEIFRPCSYFVLFEFSFFQIVACPYFLLQLFVDCNSEGFPFYSSSSSSPFSLFFRPRCFPPWHSGGLISFHGRLLPLQGSYSICLVFASTPPTWHKVTAFFFSIWADFIYLFLFFSSFFYLHVSPLGWLLRQLRPGSLCWLPIEGRGGGRGEKLGRMGKQERRV